MTEKFANRIHRKTCRLLPSRPPASWLQVFPALCIIFIPPSLLATSQTARENEQLATVEGQVVNEASKEVVSKAHVLLEPAEGSQSQTLVATTDDSGKFRFADIRIGSYHLTAEKVGFLESRYGATAVEDSGSLLSIRSAEKSPVLTLHLFPAGTISGQVRMRTANHFPAVQ